MVHSKTDQLIPRRAFVINVFADGTFSDSDEPLLEGVPAIRKGSETGGQVLPITN